MSNNSVTLTKGEFDAFWAEVLGQAWFIDEWDADDDAIERSGSDYTFTLTILDRAWQGSSDPQTNDYLTSRDLDSRDTLPVLRRWLAGQKMRHVSGWIPQGAVEEFEQFLARVGGHA